MKRNKKEEPTTDFEQKSSEPLTSKQDNAKPLTSTNDSSDVQIIYDSRLHNNPAVTKYAKQCYVKTIPIKPTPSYVYNPYYGGQQPGSSGTPREEMARVGPVHHSNMSPHTQAYNRYYNPNESGHSLRCRNHCAYCDLYGRNLHHNF